MLHDLCGFRQHDFDVARVLAGLIGEAQCLLGGAHVLQLDIAIFRLRDHFLGDDDHVA